jgi:transposase
MKTHIDDAAFELISNYLKHERCLYRMSDESLRRFIEAVYWIARSGAQWRMLPPEYGYWNAVYRRFDRWSKQGIWKRMFHYFSQDSDLEWLMIDSTIVRAHACAAGAKGGRNGRRLAAAKAVLARKST